MPSSVPHRDPSIDPSSVPRSDPFIYPSTDPSSVPCSDPSTDPYVSSNKTNQKERKGKIPRALRKIINGTG
jgi:hypothetical protein